MTHLTKLTRQLRVDHAKPNVSTYSYDSMSASELAAIIPMVQLHPSRDSGGLKYCLLPF